MSLGGFSPEQLIALCGGIFIFPFFLFSALAGQMADKYEKARLIVYVKILEFFIMSLAVLGFMIGSLPVLLSALFFMGLQSSLFSPLKYSYIPQQVSSDKLVEANALLQSSTFLAILMGTIFGGIVVAIPGSGTFYVSIGVMGLSVIGLLFSVGIPKASSLDAKLSIQYNPFTATCNLIHYIFTKKNIRLPILGLAWFWFYGAALLSLIPGYGKKVLGGNEQVVIFLLTLFSIGIGLGCIACKMVSRHQLKLGLIPIGALGLSVFLFDLFFQFPNVTNSHQSLVMFKDFIKKPGSFRIIFDFSMIAFSGGLFFVPLMTFLQTTSSKPHLSRVIAGSNIIDAIFMVLASFTLIFLFSLGLNEPEIFLFLAVLNLIVTGYLSMSFMRK